MDTVLEHVKAMVIESKVECDPIGGHDGWLPRAREGANGRLSPIRFMKTFDLHYLHKSTLLAYYYTDVWRIFHEDTS